MINIEELKRQFGRLLSEYNDFKKINSSHGHPPDERAALSALKQSWVYGESQMSSQQLNAFWDVYTNMHPNEKHELIEFGADKNTPGCPSMIAKAMLLSLKEALEYKASFSRPTRTDSKLANKIFDVYRRASANMISENYVYTLNAVAKRADLMASKKVLSAYRKIYDELLNESEKPELNPRICTGISIEFQNVSKQKEPLSAVFKATLDKRSITIDVDATQLQRLGFELENNRLHYTAPETNKKQAIEKGHRFEAVLTEFQASLPFCPNRYDLVQAEIPEANI